jgi:hypothetical protein
MYAGREKRWAVQRHTGKARKTPAAGSKDLQDMREAVRDYARGSEILLRQVPVLSRRCKSGDGSQWGCAEMSAENATNSNDALNAEESVQNTEAPKRSGRKLKLLCNPQNLPEPTLSQPTLPDMQTASEDTKYAVRDFFADRVLKSKKKARERGWR